MPTVVDSVRSSLPVGAPTPRIEVPVKTQMTPAPKSGQTSTIEGIVGSSPATPEATAAAPKAVEDPTSARDQQFAAMARKEKQLRAYDRDVRAREEAFKARETEVSRLSGLQTKASNDPLGVLKDLGITYDQLTKAIVESPNPQTYEQSEMAKLAAEVTKLREDQAKAITAAEERQKSADENAFKMIQNDVKMFVQGNDEFEMIDKTGSHEQVAEYIRQVWEKENVWLDTATAAKEVENQLLEDALEVAKLKKIQSRLMPAAPSEQNAPDTKKPPMQTQSNQSKTLTNRMTSAEFRALPPRERAILRGMGVELQ